jgi:hypothetical protein
MFDLIMSNPKWDDFSNSYKKIVENKEVNEVKHCLICGKIVDLPRKCAYCNGIYCDEHRLPEKHNCVASSRRGWVAYKALKSDDSNKNQEITNRETKTDTENQNNEDINYLNEKNTQQNNVNDEEENDKNVKPLKKKLQISNINFYFNKYKYWFKNKKQKIKNSYMVIILWIIFFIVELETISSANILLLITIALLNALICFAYIYGVVGIINWKTNRKIISVFLILLTVGTIYQNPTLITEFNSSSIHNFISFEYSYIYTLIKNVLNNSFTSIGIGTIIPSLTPLKISVRIIDENLHNGASGLNVNLLYSNGSILTNCITNNTGYSMFHDIPPGLYKMEVILPEGYISSYDKTWYVNSSSNTTFVVQNLHTESKIIQLKYTIRGTSSTINFVVYGGLENYLSNHPNSTVTYTSGSAPSSSAVSQTIYLRYINEKTEKSEIKKLSEVIQQITSEKDDQARIAISIVQNIPYDYDQLYNGGIWRYPYEVLYYNKGICSQKSMLLVCILRELGFGCALLNFENQSHEAVGIHAPSQYTYTNEYAFVETTAPSIITDWHGTYSGGISLPYTPSQTIIVNSGLSMDSIGEEYNDAQVYRKLIGKGPVLDISDYNQWLSLCKKYGILTS